jgi:hypothetical protein
MVVVAATRAGRVAKVGKRHPGREGQLIPARQCGQCLGGPGGQRQELDAIPRRVVRRLRHPNLRGLRQDDVRVGAAEAERADSGDGSAAVLRPWREGLRDPQWQPVERDKRVGLREVQARRDRPVAQRQRYFDEPGHPGRRLQVANVGLDRPDQAPAARRAALRQDRAQGLRLDRIAQRRARAVRFDVLHHTWQQIRAAVGLGQHGFLRQSAGCHQPVGPTVLVGSAATDHRVDRVTIGQRLTQRLEDDDSGAFAPYVSVCPGVESLAAAVRCHHSGLAKVQTERRRQDDVRATDEGKRALALAQAAACQVDGDQRRRTGGVDRHARPAEIVKVREPVGGDAQRAPSTGVGIDAVRLAKLEMSVVIGGDADEYAGAAAG